MKRESGSALTHTNQELVYHMGKGTEWDFCSFSNIYCYKMLHTEVGKGSASVASVMCLFAGSHRDRYQLDLLINSRLQILKWARELEGIFLFKMCVQSSSDLSCPWFLQAQGLLRNFIHSNDMN